MSVRAGLRDTLSLAELLPFQARPGSVSLLRSGFFRKSDSNTSLFKEVLLLLLLLLMMATTISEKGGP